MQIVSIPTGQPIIAGKPFIVTGILRVAKPPNPNPLAGQTVVFFCNACSPIIKDSTTTIKDGSYTFRLTAPNQGSYKVAVSYTPPPNSGFSYTNAGGILNVKPCTVKPCTAE